MKKILSIGMALSLMWLSVGAVNGLTAKRVKTAADERESGYWETDLCAASNIDGEYIGEYLKDKNFISDENKVKKLAEERCGIVTKLQIFDDPALSERLEEIDKELESLGVLQTSETEVRRMFSKSENQNLLSEYIPDPVNPVDTEDVDWMAYQYEKTYTGKTYKIFEMLANPTATPGRLFSSVIDNSVYVQGNLANQIVDIYVGKIAGSVAGFSKFLSWMPYELLLPNGTPINYSSKTHFANLRANTVMLYTFIYHEAYNSWELMFASQFTKVETTVTIYLTDSNGDFDSKMVKNDFNVHAKYYDEINHVLSLFQDQRENKVHSNAAIWDGIDGITEVVENKRVYLPFKSYQYPLYLY